jgi:hypothetical protein
VDLSEGRDCLHSEEIAVIASAALDFVVNVSCPFGQPLGFLGVFVGGHCGSPSS